MNLRARIPSVVMVLAFSGMADVRPALLFTDGMAIQRETQALVWGTADPGESVTVTSSWGETETTTADQADTWMVKLKTPKTGSPYTLTVQGNNTVKIKDILAGEGG